MLSPLFVHRLVLATTGLTSLCALYGARRLTIGAATASVGLSLYDRSLRWPAAAALFATAALSLRTWPPQKRLHRFMRYAPWAQLVLLALCERHLLSGVERYVRHTPILFREDATLFRASFNLDKTVAAAMVILGGRVALGKLDGMRRIFHALQQSLLPSAVLAGLLLGPALASGHVRFDPAWSPSIGWWWLHNFLFVAMPQETLFRGLLVERLYSLWVDKKHGPLWILLVSSIAFGAIHYKGGATFVALSCLAGIGYGWAAARAGGILGGIFAHVIVNTVHFLCFTYPALARR